MGEITVTVSGKEADVVAHALRLLLNGHSQGSPLNLRMMGGDELLALVKAYLPSIESRKPPSEYPPTSPDADLLAKYLEISLETIWQVVETSDGAGHSCVVSGWYLIQGPRRIPVYVHDLRALNGEAEWHRYAGDLVWNVCGSNGRTLKVAMRRLLQALLSEEVACPSS